MALIPFIWPHLLISIPEMTEQNKIPYPLLVTDCSCPGARVGILAETGWLAYKNKAGETGAVLFEAVKEVLSETGLSLGQLAGFVYCEGPGSTLGIRINAMALRTWISLEDQPPLLFAFKSLEAAACLIRETESKEDAFAVFSDYRKESWNGCRSDQNGHFSPIEIIDLKSLESWQQDQYFVQQRIHSPGQPPKSKSLNYDLEPLGTSPRFIQIMEPREQPGVFQTTTPTFKKWVPERHR